MERGVEKSGRHRGQAWWEKWGEQHNGSGDTLKWTDKWQGLTLVHFSAQRRHILWDTLGA